MFSFSKVLAFGLVALSSVRAIPFMQTSCSIDFGMSIGPARAFNVLDEGFYNIINVATDTLAYATDYNWQVAVANKGQFVGWTTWGHAETFAVEQAGSGEFILTYSFKVKEVTVDEDWTAENGTVRLIPSNGKKEKRWRFVKL
ncbi:hypothetical protein C8J57DRAFT_1240759 [Mycena rebaudengoi]|nr:hypothetical protein C8J57DRAFT_1240759 [Mycena rebaudengoi]